MSTCAPFVHLVARAHRLPVALTSDEVAFWLWPRLQRAFPLALMAVLMPNHLHLVAPASCANEAREKLALVLGNMARSGGERAEIGFERVPRTELQGDASKLLRQLRYVPLNPVRAKLVDDPIAWRWSTHRDVLGAIERPWITAARLALVLGRTELAFARWWHQYVARDETVASSARRFPVPAEQTRFASVPLQDVAKAVASATRTPLDDVRKRSHARDLFLAVSPCVGWGLSTLLADFCGVTQRAVQKAGQRAARRLDEVLLCLGDTRLR